MDHDRSKGENAGPQEYSLIKMQICKPYPKVLKLVFILQSSKKILIVTIL